MFGFARRMWKTPRSKSLTRDRRFCVETLENRIALASIAGSVYDDGDGNYLYSASELGLSSGFNVGSVGQAAMEPTSDEFTADRRRELHQSTMTREVVFVDATILDHQQLIENLLAQRAAGRTIESVVLQANVDGIDQITEALSRYSQLDAVHILSHGRPGGVQLGASWLTGASLAGYAGQIAMWGSHLKSDGDLLLYGCDLAASAEGRQLIDGLSALTGADVAASNNVTGNAASGGDWNLEYADGPVDAAAVLNQPLGLAWSGLLAAGPMGGETPVNSTTAKNQQTAFESPQSIAVDAAGNYVVTWSDSAADGSGFGVYARRFNAAGTALGAQFRVNTTTASNQMNPTADMDFAGNFVIAWSGNGPGDTAGVFAQSYNAAAVAQGPEFRVNTTAANTQQHPSVALDSVGNFVIVWQGEGTGDTAGIFGQRYTAGGVAVGGEFRVNTTTTNDQQLPAVDMNPAGEFVVVWSGNGAGDDSGVFAKRYDALGVAVGSEFRVNTTTTNTQQSARVAMNSAGDFVVAWSGAGTGDSSGVFAQRYNMAGVAQGSEFRVNTTTANTQQYATIASDSSGNFLITWTDSAADGNKNGVYAQQFNAAGIAQGQQFLVNSTTSKDQQYSSAVIAPNGDFTIVWSGNGAGDSEGLFQRRFDTHQEVMYGVSGRPFNIVTIDLATGAASTVGTGSYSSSASARDPVSGDLFYVESVTKTPRLSRYNPLTGTNSLIASLPTVPATLIKMSFRSDGTLWAATGSPNDMLYQLSPDTGAIISSGAVTLAGGVSLPSGSGDMAFDANNNLYWISGGSLYTVNTSSRIATLVNVVTPALTLNGIAFGSNGLLYAHSSSNAIYTINTSTASATLVGSTNTSGLRDLSSSSVIANDAPLHSVPATQSIPEDTPLVFSTSNGNLMSLRDSDAGNAALEVKLTGVNGVITLSGLAGLTFTSGDGVADSTMTFTGTQAAINTALAGLSLMPTDNFFGRASLQITTNDLGNAGAGGPMSDTDTIGIIVTPVDDPPVPVGDTFVTNEDTPVAVSVLTNDSDVEGNPFRITLVDGQAITAGGPAVPVASGAVSLNAAGNQLTFMPAANFNGSASFTYTISDGNGGTATATVGGTVVAVNDPPVAMDDTFVTNEDTPVAVNVLTNDSDLDGSPLRITLVDGQAITAGGPAVSMARGSVSLNSAGTQLTFTPAANYNGLASFAYTISDGNGGTATATVGGTVVAVNDPPVAVDDTFVTNEDTPVAVTVLTNDNDVEDNPLTVTHVDGQAITAGGPAVSVANGTVSLNAAGNQLTFTPNTNHNGPASFTYTISDGNGGTATATVSGSVIDDLLAPVSLRGWTYLDLDRDGNYDYGDTPLANVDVQLTGINDHGNAVSQLLRSAADGSYAFTNLRPGRYELRGTTPAGYTDGRETMGRFEDNSHPVPDNGVLYNDRFADIVLAAGRHGRNYNFGEFDDSAVGGILATTFDTTLVIEGTSSDDVFEFIAGTTEHKVLLNGQVSIVDASVNTKIIFYGRGGNNTAQLTGGAGVDQVELRESSAKLTGVSYQVLLYTTRSTTSQSGGGEDRALFYDTPGNEIFTADSAGAALAGLSFAHSAFDFHRVYAYATSGTDIAAFSGSNADDRLTATATDTRMEGPGYYNYARGFDIVHADAGAGADDRAYLYDSPGDDFYVATANESRMYGSSFDNHAHGFDRVYAYASGGFDQATFHDTSGTDYYKVDNDGARMYGNGYYNRAIGFDSHDVYFSGNDGQVDKVDFDDSSGNDRVSAVGNQFVGTRDGRSHCVWNPGFVVARASVGRDLAYAGVTSYVLQLEGDWEPFYVDVMAETNLNLQKLA